MNIKRILSKITAMTLAGAILFGDVVPVFANSQVEDATVIEESVADDSNTEGIQIKEESSSDSSVGDSDTSTEESSQDSTDEYVPETVTQTEVSEEVDENNDFSSEDSLENTQEEAEDTENVSDENVFCSHEFSYNDNGDGTHTTVCLLCENFEPVTESHTFNESGLCVCGVIKEKEAETEAEDSKQIQSVTYENSFENKAETDSIIVSVFAETGVLPDCAKIDIKLEETDGKTEVFLLPGFKDDCLYDLDNSVFENCSLQVTVESKDEQNSIVSIKKGDNEIASSNEGTVSFEVNDFESFSVFLSSGFVDTTLQTEVGEASVSISGEMPENAEIKAVPVSSVRKYESLVKENGVTFSVIWACDISIEVDGEPWQPVDDGKTVTVEVSGIDLNANCDSVDVYRIEDTEEEATKLSSDVNSEENTVSFETEHFTVFTVGSTSYNSSDSTEFAVGDSITGYLFSDGTLILDGSGATYDYENTTSIFYNNANIKKVVVNEGITTLGAYLFQNCSNLKSVSLSEGITLIKKNCFDSSALSGTLVFPSTLKQIGSFSFNNTAISEVVVNSTVTGAYDMVAPYPSFSNCNNLTTATYNEGVTNTGAKLFLECYSLTTVNLPSTIKNIGSRSFNSCVNLKSFPFNEGIVSIYDAAFEGSGLSGNITLPTTLANTYYDAFKNCDSLTSVTVQSVIKAGQGMINDCATFPECDNLTTFTFVDGVTSTGSNLCRGMKNLTTVSFADSVTTIGTGTFCDTTLTDVTLPSTLTKIGSYAFSNALKLENVTFANGISSLLLGNYCFNGCKALATITLPEGTTSVPSYAFQNCTALESIILPSTCTAINSYAFSGCTKLASIAWPGVETISNDALSGCTALGPTLEFPASCQSLGASTFKGCTGITKLVFNGATAGANNTSWPSFVNCSNITDVVFNEGVTGVGDYLLIGRNSITSVTLPSTLESVGISSFYNCTNAFADGLVLPNGVETIGKNAFYGNTALTDITIPKSVTTIGNTAFYVSSTTETTLHTRNTVAKEYNWTGDKRTVTIPPQQYVLNTAGDLIGTLDDTGKLSITGTGTNLDKLLSNVLRDDASELTSLSFDTDTIEVIRSDWCRNEDSVFPELTGNLVLPDKLKKIGSFAFYKCSGFTGNLVIPDSVISIGNWAFRNCSGFDGTLTLGNHLQTIETSAFGNDNFTGNLIIPDSVTSIGMSAFQGCDNFNGSLVLSNSLTTLNPQIFWGCSGFTGTLTIPDSVTTIGKSAFYSCSGLKDITIGIGVTTIGLNAFKVSNETNTIVRTSNEVAKAYDWAKSKRILLYEVTYKDYSGNNTLYTEVVTSGNAAVYVNDSVYEWVTEANGTTVADLSNVTDFVTVYGFPAVNVTFKSYDGTVTYATERIKLGGSPSYTNPDVAEWYTEANGSTVANLTSVSADVTVFGKKACSYKVKVPLTVDMQYDSSRNVAEKDFSVSLEYTIPDDGTISVYVGDSRDFKVSIANTTDPSKTISADVSYENNSFTMANGTAQEDGSRISDNTWTISASDIPVAGEYRGTMRFVIEYQE